MLEDFRCELGHSSAVVRVASLADHSRAKQTYRGEPANSISHVYLFANID